MHRFPLSLALAFVLIPALDATPIYKLTDLGAQANSGTASSLPSLGGADSWALATNSAGTIAGASQSADGAVHAVYWQGGIHDLGFLPGGGWSSAYAINDTGAIAGTSATAASPFHAFRWTAEGGMQDLGTLGGSLSYGLGIDETGSVVGSAQASSGYLHAFVWSPQGVMTDLGTLGGGSSFAYGINGAGLIVGSSYVQTSQNAHAFIYSGGVMLDLNTMTSGLAGWELTEASGVNAQGQITGSGLLDGIERTFRLDPLTRSLGSTMTAAPVTENPEPDSWALSITGLVGLAVLARKKAGKPGEW